MVMLVGAILLQMRSYAYIGMFHDLKSLLLLYNLFLAGEVSFYLILKNGYPISTYVKTSQNVNSYTNSRNTNTPKRKIEK
jgi:hypothetical protein